MLARSSGIVKVGGCVCQKVFKKQLLLILVNCCKQQVVALE